MNDNADGVFDGKLTEFNQLPEVTQDDIIQWITDTVPQGEGSPEWVRANLANQADPMVLRVYEAKLSDIPAYKKRNPNTIVVKKYQEQLSSGEAPPILVAHDDFLDGGHRAYAYARSGREAIPAVDITPILNMDWEKWFSGEDHKSHPVKSRTQPITEMAAVYREYFEKGFRVLIDKNDLESAGGGDPKDKIIIGNRVDNHKSGVASGWGVYKMDSDGWGNKIRAITHNEFKATVYYYLRNNYVDITTRAGFNKASKIENPPYPGQTYNTGEKIRGTVKKYDGELYHGTSDCMFPIRHQDGEYYAYGHLKSLHYGEFFSTSPDSLAAESFGKHGGVVTFDVEGLMVYYPSSAETDLDDILYPKNADAVAIPDSHMGEHEFAILPKGMPKLKAVRFMPMTGRDYGEEYELSPDPVENYLVPWLEDCFGDGFRELLVKTGGTKPIADKIDDLGGDDTTEEIEFLGISVNNPSSRNATFTIKKSDETYSSMDDIGADNVDEGHIAKVAGAAAIATSMAIGGHFGKNSVQRIEPPVPKPAIWQLEDMPRPEKKNRWSEGFLAMVRTMENDVKRGWKDGKWYPYKSFEGGADTIGYGYKIRSQDEHELLKDGITDEDARSLLKDELEEAWKKADAYAQSTHNVSLRSLPVKSQEMLTEFAFNIGNLAKFPRFTAAIIKGDFGTAAKEYKRSSKDAKGRRVELSRRNEIFYNRYLSNPTNQIAMTESRNIDESIAPPLGYKIRQRDEAPDREIILLAYCDRKRVGHIQCFESRFKDIKANCLDDVNNVLKGSGITEPRVFVVLYSRLSDGHKGKGLGLALYAAAVEEAGRRGAILIKSACDFGGTSNDAERAWASTRLQQVAVVSNGVAASRAYLASGGLASEEESLQRRMRQIWASVKIPRPYKTLKSDDLITPTRESEFREIIARYDDIPKEKIETFIAKKTSKKKPITGESWRFTLDAVENPLKTKKGLIGEAKPATVSVGDLRDIQVENINTGQHVRGYLYHGSRRDDITELKPYHPTYDGSIGWGLYLAEKTEAENYGPHTYRVPVDLKNPFRVEHNMISEDYDGTVSETLLSILKKRGKTYREWAEEWGADFYDDEDGDAPSCPMQSLLVGEEVYPFWFLLHNELIGVFDNRSMEDIAGMVHEAGHDAVVIEGLRHNSSFQGHEVVVFTDHYPDEVDGESIANEQGVVVEMAASYWDSIFEPGFRMYGKKYDKDEVESGFIKYVVGKRKGEAEEKVFKLPGGDYGRAAHEVKLRDDMTVSQAEEKIKNSAFVDITDPDKLRKGTAKYATRVRKSGQVKSFSGKLYHGTQDLMFFTSTHDASDLGNGSHLSSLNDNSAMSLTPKFSVADSFADNGTGMVVEFYGNLDVYYASIDEDDFDEIDFPDEADAVAIPFGRHQEHEFALIKWEDYHKLSAKAVHLEVNGQWKRYAINGSSDVGVIGEWRSFLEDWCEDIFGEGIAQIIEKVSGQDAADVEFDPDSGLKWENIDMFPWKGHRAPYFEIHDDDGETKRYHSAEEARGILSTDGDLDESTTHKRPLPKVLYHGTTEDQWKRKHEAPSWLYLGDSEEEAWSYAYETGSNDEIDGADPKPVVMSISPDELRGFEWDADHGWYGYNSESTWQDSFNAVGSFSVRGDIDSIKKNFTRVKHAKTIIESYNPVDNSFVDIINSIRKVIDQLGKPTTWHRYAASEALWYAIGSQRSGFYPRLVNAVIWPDVLRLGQTHWFLMSHDGSRVIDPTWDQFDVPVPYSKGTPASFLTKRPSRRAAEILKRAGLDKRPGVRECSST